MGNSATFEIKGQGKVVLKMNFGKELTLNNILYVLKIHKNLVLTSLMNKHGFCMVFESDKVYLSKSGLFIGKDNVTEGLFKLNIMIIRPRINNNNCCTSYLLKFSNFWHGRIWQVNYNTLHKLINLNHIPAF